MVYLFAFGAQDALKIVLYVKPVLQVINISHLMRGTGKACASQISATSSEIFWLSRFQPSPVFLGAI